MQDAPPLIDLYTLPHKAIRAAVAHAAMTVGATDPDGIAEAASAVGEALGELAAHAAHEEEFIDPLLERRLPDAAIEVAEQHRRLGATIDGVLRQRDGALAVAPEQPGAVLGLYRALQRLAAENLLHLDHEETVVMPALWVVTPPHELQELMASFRAAHPDAAALYRRWPAALAATERRLVGVGEASTVPAPERQGPSYPKPRSGAVTSGR
ncbi:hemerythrin domain-containing protein [Dermatobacter hominis]|uniref:hemerythrin domain-containing protein n=1 Tax=Dermatobacter hominis TaxID=2884263 RepID=UPI001D10EBB2|nr:hemerythrin domain-containing protein [Dermatobacter hominis]UDY34086.1 hemerythrin domain-containing protein [Dermatobacter hominis]